MDSAQRLWRFASAVGGIRAKARETLLPFTLQSLKVRHGAGLVTVLYAL